MPSYNTPIDPVIRARAMGDPFPASRRYSCPRHRTKKEDVFIEPKGFLNSVSPEKINTNIELSSSQIENNKRTQDNIAERFKEDDDDKVKQEEFERERSLKFAQHFKSYYQTETEAQGYSLTNEDNKESQNESNKESQNEDNTEVNTPTSQKTCSPSDNEEDDLSVSAEVTETNKEDNKCWMKKTGELASTSLSENDEEEEYEDIYGLQEWNERTNKKRRRDVLPEDSASDVINDRIKRARKDLEHNQRKLGVLYSLNFAINELQNMGQTVEIMEAEKDDDLGFFIRLNQLD